MLRYREVNMKNKFSMVPIFKKVAPVLLVSVFLLPLPAHSEIKAGSVEVSPFAGYNFFERGQNLKNRPVFGGRLGYNITNSFGIEAAGEFIKSRVDDRAEMFTKEGQFTTPIDGVKITMYHLDFLYHFMPESKFNPFVVAGYGAAHYRPEINNKNMSVINFGVGVKYWMADSVALRLDIRDNMIFDEKIHGLETTLGVVFAFGGEKNAAMVTAEPRSSVVTNSTIPTVIFTAPVNGATMVSVNQKTNVAFSEDMDATTISTETFTLKQGGTPVSGSVTATGSTATFTPTNNYEKGKVYNATVTTGAKNLAGNGLANDYMWKFNAGQAADTTAPTVAFTSPVKGDKTTPVNQKVNAAFSEYMDPRTINGATFTIKQGSTPVAGKVTANASTATFTPASNFEKGKVYTATVTTGTKDLAGNALARNYAWDFTAYQAPKVISVLATLENSHFDFNSTAISENGKTILNHNVKSLKANPNMKLRIAGYTSASGSEEYNQDLSERRAEAVKAYLVKTGGIDGSRLATVGYGKRNPAKHEVDPSDKLSAEALANMRVVIEVVEE